MLSERKNDGIDRSPEQWFSRANPTDRSKGGAEKTRAIHGQGWMEHARKQWADLLGSKRLDAITTEQVQRVKKHLATRKPKTVNDVLTVLNMLLKKAVEWDVIDRMPCTIRLLPVPKPSARFHDFADYERLVTAGRELCECSEVIVLLGGEAGLRCGEIAALEWRDVDLSKRQLCVQRSDWRGHVTTTKGGRLRYVPMTTRLTEALRRVRHLKGPRVLCDRESGAFTPKMVSDHVRRAAQRASLANRGVTCCATRSAHIWRCAVHRRGRSRNLLVIRSSGRRSATCT
jgi:integrase